MSWRTKLVYIDAGKPAAAHGVHVIVGISGIGEPYLFSVLDHGRNEVGGVELGIFSDDSDLVDGVRARTETGLPPWIEVGETKNLKVWKLEDVYTIVSKRRALVN
ncbi:MAG: hypothetical protein HY051_05125 [Candidatus Aenigmarchaeota archaeon]|nr:hypothetical protein [Candidatus Aenigmarchaeota archaeon]